MLHCQGAINGDGGMVFKQIKWKMLHCQGAINGDGGMVFKQIKWKCYIARMPRHLAALSAVPTGN
jgi:hypothetical protein